MRSFTKVLNFTDFITRHAQYRPDHPAIIDGDCEITYAELDRLVDNAACNLSATGIEVGDSVGVALPDCLEYLIVMLALARMGAVLLALDDKMTPSDRQQLLTTSKCKAVAGTKPGTLHGLKVLDVSAICSPSNAQFNRPELPANHPLMFGQSSGTTGKPKLFLASHNQIKVRADLYESALNWSPNDRRLIVTSLSFFSERVGVLELLQLAATIAFNRARTLGEFVHQVHRLNITTLVLTPVHLSQLLAYHSNALPLFPSIKDLVVVSHPITHNNRLLARQRLTPHLYEHYGTNEAGILIVGSPAHQDSHPNAIGRVIPGIETRVIGVDGSVLAPGEVGLVGFRHEGVISGYVNDAKATTRQFRDGWFYPGDLAAIDADGFFYFKGRADDVINKQGVKFYPVEIETALLAHPSVQEAAVFGWSVPHHGEVPVAFIVVSKDVTRAELKQFCKSRIAGYKFPDRLVRIEKMPRNAAGKILKRDLKAAFAKMLEDRTSD